MTSTQRTDILDLARLPLRKGTWQHRLVWKLVRLPDDFDLSDQDAALLDELVRRKSRELNRLRRLPRQTSVIEVIQFTGPWAVRPHRPGPTQAAGDPNTAHQ